MNELIQLWINHINSIPKEFPDTDDMDWDYISKVNPPRELWTMTGQGFLRHTVKLIQVYVTDELQDFHLLAVYDSFNELSALLTEIDTTWTTIYTNEEN